MFQPRARNQSVAFNDKRYLKNSVSRFFDNKRYPRNSASGVQLFYFRDKWHSKRSQTISMGKKDGRGIDKLHKILVDGTQYHDGSKIAVFTSLSNWTMDHLKHIRHTNTYRHYLQRPILTSLELNSQRSQKITVRLMRNLESRWVVNVVMTRLSILSRSMKLESEETVTRWRETLPSPQNPNHLMKHPI